MVTRTKKNEEIREEIENEKRKERNTKIRKVVIKVIIIVLIILIISYIILRYVGNIGIVVKENVVVSNKLPESFNGLKIIHFSDLHYGTTIKEKKLKEIVKVINKSKPDIIVFTGDLIDDYSKIKDNDKNVIKECLKEMQAKLGKYIVQGNHDKKILANILENTDFILLQNSYELIYNEGYSPILLVGLGSRNLKQRDIDKAYAYFNKEDSNQDIFTVSLLHEPDDIDVILEKFPTDLALAGHSHNGQIRLPFLESLVKVEGAKKYYEAHYKINNTELFISGGLGNSHYPFRLFNHPSINLIRVRSK